MKNSDKVDETNAPQKNIHLKFKCKDCGVEGNMLIQEVVYNRDKKKNRWTLKDNILVNELCWHCDWIKRGLIKRKDIENGTIT